MIIICNFLPAVLIFTCVLSSKETNMDVLVCNEHKVMTVATKQSKLQHGYLCTKLSNKLTILVHLTQKMRAIE